ncbi:MAG TPA: hypothetical protein VNI77_12495 [Nitrososphaera sp.]|nr:hypothetical protein [Nitrososphaera sp.]
MTLPQPRQCEREKTVGLDRDTTEILDRIRIIDRRNKKEEVTWLIQRRAEELGIIQKVTA